jgi:hypothetical protein
MFNIQHVQYVLHPRTETTRKSCPQMAQLLHATGLTVWTLEMSLPCC